MAKQSAIEQDGSIIEALDNASIIDPSCSIADCFAIN
jgi:hypothetical protein